MVVYVLSVDSERCKYLAFYPDPNVADAVILAESHTSTEEAVGRLVRNNPGIQVDQVVEIRHE